LYSNKKISSAQQLKFPGEAEDFFEMNLPYCLLAEAVKKEIEAVGSYIQVGGSCGIPHTVQYR
jgi:hypothetical protein